MQKSKYISVKELSESYSKSEDLQKSYTSGIITGLNLLKDGLKEEDYGFVDTWEKEPLRYTIARELNYPINNYRNEGDIRYWRCEALHFRFASRINNFPEYI